jgi:predicted ATPase/transcriptional regulator with XRE-family HTH domain
MTIDSPSSFGLALRRLRLAAGLSQEELAERAGLSARGVSDLERGLRASPRPETVRMLADALQLAPADRAEFIAAARPELQAPEPPAAAPAEPSPAPPATHVPPLDLEPPPVPPTRLVGREADVARVCALLRRDAVRLLTLTGPGGVGKTRLALAVAGELAGDECCADGVALVELAPLRDASLVPSALARALGLKEEGGQPLLDAVKAAVQGRHLCLILDNAEHLLPVGLVVAELLASSPGLLVVVTSRERLHLRGEREIPVAPLAVPASSDPLRPVTLEGLAGVAAVRLFVERAEEASLDFALTDETAHPIAEVVRRLEGLPLAIELAAAWIRDLSPGELLERLTRRLPVLADGPRDLPARQRTLRAAIEWSHDLLRPDEQALLRRLAVFAGGWDLAAADAIGQGARSTLDSVLAGIESLLDKSLIRQALRSDGESRFEMLETIREFGLERLEAAGEEAATHRAHADHYLTLVKTASPELAGSQQQAWLERLETEHDNFRVALGWTIDNEPARGTQLANGLVRFWHQRGHIAEGRAWCERTAAVSGLSPDQHARTLADAGLMAWANGDWTESERLYQRSLDVYRSAGEEGTGAATALGMLAIMALNRGDRSRGRSLNEECVSLFRRLGDRARLAAALGNLGVMAERDDDYTEAAALVTEALALYREVGDQAGVARMLENLGVYAKLQDDLARAAEFYRESLELSRALNYTPHLTALMVNVADLAVTAGEPVTAARLFGASETLGEASGVGLLPSQAETRERGIAETRELLGQAAFQAAWAAGRTLSIDDATAEAAALIEAVAASRVRTAPT